MPGTIDERLTELTEENATLKATIDRLTKENGELQIDFANKLASTKVDYETKEIEYKRKIKDLTMSLELRNSNERAKDREKDKGKLSVKQLWENALDE